jgi:hypothetical protein
MLKTVEFMKYPLLYMLHINRSPNFAKGVEKVAFSLAIMASHNVADVTQAPIAGPLAATIKGFGKSIKASKMAALFLQMKSCSF